MESFWVYKDRRDHFHLSTTFYTEKDTPFAYFTVYIESFYKKELYIEIDIFFFCV